MARPDAPGSHLEYAGFWLRVGAVVIDSALVAIIIVPLMWWAYGERYFLGPDLLMGPADLPTWKMRQGSAVTAGAASM